MHTFFKHAYACVHDRTGAHKRVKPHIHTHSQYACLQPVDLAAAFVHVLRRKKMTFLVHSIVCCLSISSGPLAPTAFLSPHWQRVTLPWQPTFGGMLACPIPSQPERDAQRAESLLGQNIDKHCYSG